VIGLDGNAVAGDLIEILGVDHAAPYVRVHGTSPKKGFQ
jgi:hypothetical protein